MTENSTSPAEILPAGTTAPDFTLPTTPERSVTLSELRGRPVVLVFYPFDWSPVCSDELVVFTEALSRIGEHGATVLGISVDSVWSHQAYRVDRAIGFELLADFEPKGVVAREYGIYESTGGFAGRALFVLDGAGVIRWCHLSPPAVNPGVDGVLDALSRLDAGDSSSA